ncbi:PRC-barrel domain-containing protein [Roseovarius indicus]|uniref:PRC-barrel domain-containing protein n=1 Tax=Roseovarius indicus TaxID=540747 RepID=UPI0040587420
MKNATRTLMLSTALTFPLAGFVSAQTLETMSDEELNTKSAECQMLVEAARSDDLPALIPMTDLVAAVDADNPEKCAMISDTISAEGEQTETDTETATAQAEESETVSEQVNLSESATIEGQARVTVPEPDVDVQVPAPNVTVMKQLPRVTVNESPLDIQIAQQQPNIEVEIPEIVVRVNIPAPDVYILSSDPDVQISTDDPQVQVEQGEPTISVVQADPELAVDLGVDAGETAENTEMSDTDMGETQSVAGDTSVDASEPQVAIQQAEGEPEINVEGGETSVAYEKSEPRISVIMANEPTVDVQQGGEANVVIETAEEREQRLSTQNEQQAQAEAPADPAANDGDIKQAADTNTMTMTVAELMDKDVLTSDGENLGRPAGFIEENGAAVLVLSSGGFLGLGTKEVPVPMDRVSVQNDTLIVETMSEEEVEDASGFDFSSAQQIADDETIDVSGM